MSKSIILIGNGSSVLDKQNGSQIDLFDIVVRFNSFKIKNFEKYVGNKTDYWVTVNNKHIDIINSFKQTFVHSWEYNQKKCKLFKEISEKTLPIKFSKDLINSIPINYPSTGLIAIHYFLMHHPKVHITGFDWWERETHHYGDIELRGNLHKPEKEYEIIKRLIDHNKVILI